MWPFSSMDSNVPFQQAGSVKCFATIVTWQHVLFPSPWHSTFSSAIVIGLNGLGLNNGSCGLEFFLATFLAGLS